MESSWVMSYVREEDGQVSLLIADCEDLENVQTLKVASKSSNTKTPQSLPKKETLSFSCADGFLKLSDLPRPHGERPVG